MNPPRLALIELQPSRSLAALLAVAHGGALWMLATLTPPWWVMAAGAAVLGLNAATTILRHALLRGAGAVTAMEFSDREQLRLRTGDGAWQEGLLLGSSMVSAGLAVLNISRAGKGVVHVIIVGDAIDRDDFRRLRVWLRWGPRRAGHDAGSG